MGIAAILAPIMAAIAQIEAAKQQAEADKFIAKTAADASIAQTNKQAEVTLSLAADQKQIAEKNLAATTELAERQEKNSKERLLLQLAAIEKERTALSAERAEIRSIEQKRADDQIAFAREQAQQNLQLAQLALNAQLVNQGLSTTGGSSSGDRLSNTASGATAGSAFNNTLASNTGSGLGNIIRSATGATGSTGGTGTSTTGTTGGRSSIVARNTGTAQAALGGRATPAGQAAAPSRLLASLRQGFLADKSRGFTSGAPGAGGAAGGFAAGSGVIEGFRFTANGEGVVLGQAVPLELTMAMTGRQTVRGSTRDHRNRIEGTVQSGSDLGNFISTVSGSGMDMSDEGGYWRHSTRGNAGGVAGSGHQK